MGREDVLRWHLQRNPQGLTTTRLSELTKTPHGTVHSALVRVRGAYIAAWRNNARGRPCAVWRHHEGPGPKPENALPPWKQRRLSNS